MQLFRLPAWISAAACTLLCVGCGTTSTTYKFSAATTGRQQAEVMQVVDSAARQIQAHRMSGPAYEQSNAFCHTYRHGSLSIQTGIEDRRIFVGLSEDGRRKTREFITAERALTPALRHLDPRLTIHSGYTQNPMM